MRKSYFFFFLLFAAIYSCSSSEGTEVSQNDSSLCNDVFTDYVGIAGCKLLDSACTSLLVETIDWLIITSDSDSVVAAYYINANLFEGHYADEDAYYEKYAVLLKSKDTTQPYFFAIHKSASALHLMNYLTRFEIFVVDPRSNCPADFNLLSENGFGQIDNSKEGVNPDRVYYDLITFCKNPDMEWQVDSVVGEPTNCFFRDQMIFNVIGDSLIRYNEGEMIYDISNYTMYINSEESIVEHWLLSRTEHYMILRDENDNYIFVSHVVEANL